MTMKMIDAKPVFFCDGPSCSEQIANARSNYPRPMDAWWVLLRGAPHSDAVLHFHGTACLRKWVDEQQEGA